MVVPNERQRRHRAFRRLFGGGRGISILKRSFMEPKSHAENSIPNVLPQAPDTATVKPPLTPNKPTASSRGFRSFRILQEHRQSDIEVKVTNDGSEQRESDDSTQMSSGKDDETTDLQNKIDNTSRQEEQSGDIYLSRDSVLIKALSHVEFQDDNNQVHIFDNSTDDQQRGSATSGVVSEQKYLPTDSAKSSLLPTAFVEVDPMQELDSSNTEQPQNSEAKVEACTITPTTLAAENESLQCGGEGEEDDWQTVEHSVQNETMSEVSALTRQGSRSTADSYSDSSSGRSYDASYTSSVYPDVLLVRTKTQGTNVTNNPESERRSEKDKSKIDFQAEETGDREDEDGGGDDGDESDSEGESEALTEDSEACESDEDDDDEETSAEASSYFSLAEKSEKDVSSSMEVDTKDSIDGSEDAFADIPDDASLERTLEIDDESAYTFDDNNVPFVDPIEVKIEQKPGKPEAARFHVSVEKHEEGHHWRLFGILSYE